MPCPTLKLENPLVPKQTFFYMTCGMKQSSNFFSLFLFDTCTFTALIFYPTIRLYIFTTEGNWRPPAFVDCFHAAQVNGLQRWSQRLHRNWEGQDCNTGNSLMNPHTNTHTHSHTHTLAVWISLGHTWCHFLFLLYKQKELQLSVCLCV